MRNAGVLLVRLIVGTLVAGHGAQKLFGWFEGPGLEGTTGMVEKMGFRPARPWAVLAALSEFGGGVLTALGFLNPVGPMGIVGAMGIATTKAHWGKPIWVSKGGAELPVINATVATAVALAGPGKWSLDRALGLRLPRWTLLPAFALTAGGIAAGVLLSRQPAAQLAAQPTAEPAPEPEMAPAPAPAEPRAAAAPAQPATPAPTQPLPETVDLETPAADRRESEAGPDLPV